MKLFRWKKSKIPARLLGMIWLIIPLSFFAFSTLAAISGSGAGIRTYVFTFIALIPSFILIGFSKQVERSKWWNPVTEEEEEFKFPWDVTPPRDLVRKLANAERLKKIAKYIVLNITLDELVDFCIVGLDGQTIAVLERRLLIVKTGLLAGQISDAMITSIFFNEVIKVEVDTSDVTGGIIVQANATSGTTLERLNTEDMSSAERERNLYKAANCIPIFSNDVSFYQQSVNKLEQVIKKAKERMFSPKPSSTIQAKLEKLNSYKTLGILTDKEFREFRNKLSRS